MLSWVVGLFYNCTFLVGKHTASRPALRLLGVDSGWPRLRAPGRSAECEGARGRGPQLRWDGRSCGYPSHDAGVSWAAPGAVSPWRVAGERDPRQSRGTGCSPPLPPTAPHYPAPLSCPKETQTPARAGCQGQVPPRRAVCPHASLSVPRRLPTSPPCAAPCVRRGRATSQRHPSEKLMPNEGGISR